MIQPVEIWLEAKDGARLNANLYQTDGGKTKPVIIIAAATASPQAYYAKFAAHAASQGFNVLTFDYRGVGKSLYTSLKNSRAKMTDWGIYDLDAAIIWLKQNGYRKIHLLGHSVAGQVFPLAANAHRIKSAYFVASQTASQRYWSGFEKFKVWIFWYILIPTLTLIYGYLPGWSMGGKVGIPSTAAWEWRSWGKHPLGVLQGIKSRKEAFADISIAVHFISLEHDETLAPKRAVQVLKSQYAGATTSYEHLLAKNYDIKRLSHFDFFRSKMKNTLWDKPLEFFRTYP